MKLKTKIHDPTIGPQTFHPFMRLPLELRRMVYATYFHDVKSFEPDVFTIENVKTGGTLLRCHIHALSLVSKEGFAEIKHLQDKDMPRAMRITVVTPVLNCDRRKLSPKTFAVFAK